MLGDVKPRRLARRLGWHRNEMSRGSDRAEGWLTVTLVLLFLLCAPLLGFGAGKLAYRSEKEAHDAVRLGLTRVDAVVLDAAAEPGPTDGTGMPAQIWVARARWTAPTGEYRAGYVQLAEQRPAGDHIGLWLDEHGVPAVGPRRAQPGTEATVAAIAAVLSRGGAFLCGTVGASALLVGAIIADRFSAPPG
jgi:hypothetical protein